MTKGLFNRAMSLSLAVLAAWPSACSRQPADAPGSAAGGVAARAEIFSLPQLFEVTLPGPDRWEAVTNARRLEFSPRAVLLLFAKREPALIRFSLYASADLSPRGLLDQFQPQLEAAGYRCRRVIVAAHDDDPASLAFIGPEPESRRGKIFAGRLPGNAELSVLAIGQWPAGPDVAMTADFDVIVASLKAAK